MGAKGHSFSAETAILHIERTIDFLSKIKVFKKKKTIFFN